MYEEVVYKLSYTTAKAHVWSRQNVPVRWHINIILFKKRDWGKGMQGRMEEGGPGSIAPQVFDSHFWNGQSWTLGYQATNYTFALCMRGKATHSVKKSLLWKGKDSILIEYHRTPIPQRETIKYFWFPLFTFVCSN